VIAALLVRARSRSQQLVDDTSVRLT
jgi:hypothetical protein